MASVKNDDGGKKTLRVWICSHDPAGKPRCRTWCRREINGSCKWRCSVKGRREKVSAWSCTTVLRHYVGGCVCVWLVMQCAVTDFLSVCISLCSWLRDVVGVDKSRSKKGGAPPPPPLHPQLLCITHFFFWHATVLQQSDMSHIVIGSWTPFL